MSNRLTRLALLALTVALVAVTTVIGSAAWGAQEDSLCKPLPGRVTVPADFVLDACFDGTHLVLRNRKEAVVRVNYSGSVGQGKLSPVSAVPTFPAGMMEVLHAAQEPGLLPPNYILSLPVYDETAGSVDVEGVGEYQSQYILAQGFQTVIDLAPGMGFATGFPELTTSLVYTWNDFQNCSKKASGYWSRVSCDAKYTRDGSKAVLLYATNLADLKIFTEWKKTKLGIKTIRQIMDTNDWASAAVGDFTALLSGTRSLAVRMSTEPGAGEAPGGGGVGNADPSAPQVPAPVLSASHGRPGAAVDAALPTPPCPPLGATQHDGKIEVELAAPGSTNPWLHTGGGDAISPNGTLVFGGTSLHVVPYLNEDSFHLGAYPTIAPGPVEVRLSCTAEVTDGGYVNTVVTRKFAPAQYTIDLPAEILSTPHNVLPGQVATLSSATACPAGSSTIRIAITGQYALEGYKYATTAPVSGRGSWSASWQVPDELKGFNGVFALSGSCVGPEGDPLMLYGQPYSASTPGFSDIHGLSITRPGP